MAFSVACRPVSSTRLRIGKAETSSRGPTLEVPGLKVDGGGGGQEEELVDLDTVTINVGGTRHELLRKTLQNLPPSARLANATDMQRHYRKSVDEYYYERHSGVFAAVVSFWRTGELHVPHDVCGGLVRTELQYWGVDEMRIEMCCWIRYKSETDTKGALKQFDRSMSSMKGEAEDPNVKRSGLQNLRFKTWRFLEVPSSSIPALLYCIFSVLVVLLSITVFCMETHPDFKHNMTAIEYAEYYGVSKKDLIEDWDMESQYDDLDYWSDQNDFEYDGAYDDEEYDNSEYSTDDPNAANDDPNVNVDDPNAANDDPNVNVDDPNASDDDPNTYNGDDPDATDDDPNADYDDSYADYNDEGGPPDRRKKRQASGKRVQRQAPPHPRPEKHLDPRDKRQVPYPLPSPNNNHAGPLSRREKRQVPTREKRETDTSPPPPSSPPNNNHPGPLSRREKQQAPTLENRETGTSPPPASPPSPSSSSSSSSSSSPSSPPSPLPNKNHPGPLNRREKQQEKREATREKQHAPTREKRQADTPPPPASPSHSPPSNNNHPVPLNRKEKLLSPAREKRQADPSPPPPPEGNPQGPDKYVRNDDQLMAPNESLRYIDAACVIFFSLEFIVRFVACPSKRKFVVAPLNIIDLLSILPFFIILTVEEFAMAEKYQTTALDALDILKVLRVFRIFRLVRHNKGLRVLLYTFKQSWKEMALLLLFMAIGMIIFASLIYYMDYQSGVFTSIPLAFWWAIVTMTTVGYGDYAPKSGLGYLIGSFCAVSGVLAIAFTVPSIVNNFLLFYQHVQYEKKEPEMPRKKSGKVKIHVVGAEQNGGKMTSEKNVGNLNSEKNGGNFSSTSINVVHPEPPKIKADETIS